MGGGVIGIAYSELARSILVAMANESWPLRERLHAVLTGPLLELGPPWPDDVPALVDLDRQLKELQEPLDSPSVTEMLTIATDQQLEDLADTVTRVAMELAGRAED